MIPLKNMPEWIGKVRLWGDPVFDSDSVADHTSEPIRWLSYPFSKLVLNPNTKCTDTEFLQVSSEIDLSIGYIVGDQSVKPFSRGGICNVSVLNDGDTESKETAKWVETSWYPYQISYKAKYPSSQATVMAQDFFADENTIIRILTLNSEKQASLQLQGTFTGEAFWHDDQQTLLLSHQHDVQAFAIAELDDDGEVIAYGQPVLSDEGWSVKCRTSQVAFVYGFSDQKGKKGQKAAAQCIGHSLRRKPKNALAEVKKCWDQLLGNVPAPASWGITAVEAEGVTAEQHKQKYYAAWSFLISNILPATPERDFPYQQVSIGKASLWFDGSAKCPTNCAWESFYEIQLLAYVYPETAWSALEGFMSMIDEDGWLDGECLPSQKAHTAWVVHVLQPDKNRLASVYPAIRRYLYWREQNPYWLWSEGGPQKPESPLDQKDISFVSQWLKDVDYAILICSELGLEAEVVDWKKRKSQMIEKVGEWFFQDRKVQAVYWEQSGERSDNTLFTIDMLVNELSPDLDEILENYYFEKHNKHKRMAGLHWSKYGNLLHTVLGLYDRGYHQKANELTDAMLKNSIMLRDFCENEYDDKDTVNGVNPSAFTACQIIGFTWIRNGMRYEQGIPYFMEEKTNIENRIGTGGEGHE